MKNLLINTEKELNNQIEILSLKRKSDGKIFSIGDKFKWFRKGNIDEDPEYGYQDNEFSGTIREFRILAGKCHIMHLHKFSNKYGLKTVKGSNMLNLTIKLLK